MSGDSRILKRKLKCCADCPLRQPMTNTFDDLTIVCTLTDNRIDHKEDRKFPKFCPLPKETQTRRVK